MMLVETDPHMIKTERSEATSESTHKSVSQYMQHYSWRVEAKVV